SRERLNRAKKRSIYGRATTIDVLSAQVDYAADQVTWTQGQFLWDESRRNLNILLNRSVDNKFIIETEVIFTKNFDVESLKTTALSHNALFLAATERLKQTRLELKIAKAAFYPRLDLSASYGLNQSTNGWRMTLNDAVETTRIGLNLKLNIFDGFNVRVEKTIAQIQVKNQQLSVEEAQLNLEKKVISAFESYKNSLQVLELEKKVVSAAELNFKRTRELYNLGQVTTTQFREAQINLIRSRSDLSSAKYQAKLKEIELLQLTGELSSERLSLSGI
ncbi:MAG: TolC family protein, partial [Candidatus Aminicenantes bacterium]|nr:TolC family protein [Candidatus Aminicenantes bacterium]